MRIRMLTDQAGADKDGKIEVRENGQEYEVPSAEAKRLLESGQAEPVARKGSDRAEKRATAVTR